MTRAWRLPRVLGRAGLLAGWAVVSGCVPAHHARQLDERFDAGWRPSKGDCAWGGATERLAAHCARVNFGTDGALAILQAVNREALDGAIGGAMPWERHIERARAALEPYARDYAIDELEWCDASGAVCHRSLLVTDPVTGARFVLDNGRVIPGGVHVATYERFRGLVTDCGNPRC